MHGVGGHWRETDQVGVVDAPVGALARTEPVRATAWRAGCPSRYRTGIPPAATGRQGPAEPPGVAATRTSRVGGTSPVDVAP